MPLPFLKDMTGLVFSKLKVIKRRGEASNGIVKWWCVCECGNKTTVMGSHLRSGHTTSCGCVGRETNLQHGLSKHPLHRVWSTMKNRCYNASAHNYKWYGAKGISVCNKWRKDFKEFYDWAMLNGYEQGLTIDRIKNSQGYCPRNCRFITRPANTSRNRGRINSTNTSGHCGVVWDSARNKWLSTIRNDNGLVYLGRFKTKKEAITARKEAERLYY